MSRFFDTYEIELARIGISGAMAKFYLSALELGEAPVSGIAKHCGVTRTNAYSLLDKCLADGLITQIQRGRQTVVIAEHPGVLMRNLEDKRAALSDVLPTLTRLYQAGGDRPRLRTYEGLSGAKTVLNYVAGAENAEILGILSMKELQEFPGLEAIDAFVSKRVDAGKSLRVIRSATEETSSIWQTSAPELRQVRYAPTAPLVMTTFIYDDSVALISSERENFSMVIESTEFAKVQTALFEALWSASTSQKLE